MNIVAIFPEINAINYALGNHDIKILLWMKEVGNWNLKVISSPDDFDQTLKILYIRESKRVSEQLFTNESNNISNHWFQEYKKEINMANTES